MKKKKKLKRRLKKNLMLVLKLSVIMALTGISGFYFLNMLINSGLNVQTHELVVGLGEAVQAADFISNYDAEKITAVFEKEPERQEGKQEVVLIVTNSYGKSKEYKETLKFVKLDDIPPVISGVREITVNIGDPVSYLEGVTAIDNIDGIIDVTVEKASVNTREEGTYSIMYEACDSSGNVTQVSSVVNVKRESYSQIQLNELADKVLSQITDTNMSMAQKAYAIYQYAHTHIVYTGERLASDCDTESYMGLTNIENSGQSGGDCHTYCSVAKILLDRAGAKTIRVERRNGQPGNTHFWLLVNLGSGWYHFDAINVFDDDFECFMKTDAEVKEYSKLRKDYYDLDETVFPASPTTPFK